MKLVYHDGIRVTKDRIKMARTRLELQKDTVNHLSFQLDAAMKLSMKMANHLAEMERWYVEAGGTLPEGGEE